jgi:F-type H+-transporting ATPase subunit a
MRISPDELILWERGFIRLNATVAFSWGVMALLIAGSWIAGRRLRSGPDPGRLQNFLEAVIGYMKRQISEITRSEPGRYLPFLGTLFLFISLSNLLAVVPGFEPPTASISTTGALALVVFAAVPFFGIMQKGLIGYLRHYVKPTPFMAPFHVIGELSRTLALAVRLFGNIMSGTMIAGILLSVAPLFVPVLMQALSLLIGQIQAYIFAVLAAVYIGSATRAGLAGGEDDEENEDE